MNWVHVDKLRYGAWWIFVLDANQYGTNGTWWLKQKVDGPVKRYKAHVMVKEYTQQGGRLWWNFCPCAEVWVNSHNSNIGC